MNRSELKEALGKAGVSARTYSLGDTCKDESLCLKFEQDKWAVFYSERGLETGKCFFDSEAKACEYILDALLSDPTTRSSWSSGFSMRRENS